MRNTNTAVPNSKANFKANLLAPEEVETEGWYTFNLNPQEQEIMSDPLARWTKMYQHIEAIIDIFKNVAVIEGQLEISRNGRIHMHGYIKFKSPIEFYLLLPRALTRCTIEIDYIEDIEVWKTYCEKQKLPGQFKKSIKQSKEGTVKNQFMKGLRNRDYPTDGKIYL